MIRSELTNKAYVIACAAHTGQKDKAGIPYITHPWFVAKQMDDEVSTCVALLHDVLEDTAYTEEDMRLLGVPEDIIKHVQVLTRREGESYMAYIRRVKTDPIAVKVKMADLSHNSDLTRLPKVTETDLARMKKYKKAMRILQEGE